MNPSDYRVATEACGACHLEIVEASVRSMHSTGVMLWGGAAYNNGILPYKRYVLGESYDRNGVGTTLYGPKIPDDRRQAAEACGCPAGAVSVAAWETIKPGDIFRVFERGGRNIGNLFPETGLPDALGQLQRIEEPGRPDFRQSNRGPGTGARIAVPVINITKTRLNDPFTWFLGTNDQPGDYRSSGCASCHVVYANDRDPRHSALYAQYGHDGRSITVDPTIDHAALRSSAGARVHARDSDEPVHGLPHAPAEHVHEQFPRLHDVGLRIGRARRCGRRSSNIRPTRECAQVLDRNPEGAATRGKWADVDFLGAVADLNPQLKDTQFADYHGHGWNFRAVFKRDRKGNLLDATGGVVSDDRSRRSSRRRCICRRCTSTSACSASTATSRRTTTATATSTAKSRRRSK